VKFFKGDGAVERKGKVTPNEFLAKILESEETEKSIYRSVAHVVCGIQQ
jgi:hypothetical protein